MCSLVLVGCGCKEKTIKTEVQKQYVDVLYCPAPPEINRPALPIHTMTPDQKKSDGEVVKHYKATVKTLQGYAVELETIVDKQKEINKAYEDKKKELESSPEPTE
jgi:hypothetical protein